MGRSPSPLAPFKRGAPTHPHAHAHARQPPAPASTRPSHCRIIAQDEEIGAFNQSTGVSGCVAQVLEQGGFDGREQELG